VAGASERDARVVSRADRAPALRAAGLLALTSRERTHDAPSASPDEILQCWFGAALHNAEAARARAKLWFGCSAEFDALLSQRFGDLPHRLLGGEFHEWARTPRSALARIIALDQFPRNLFRKDPQAFAFDAAAVAAALGAVESGYDTALHPLEAVFVYLPFEHAEDLGMQARAVKSFETLQTRAPQGLEALFASFTQYAHRHQRVIAEFGRFPHRNKVLGREPTPAEQAYLRAGGERFGSGGS
jgi:uncharacterized protein (DUF924 family)